MKAHRQLPLSATSAAIALVCLASQGQAQMATVIPPNVAQGPFAGQALGVQLAGVPTGPHATPATVRVRTPGLAAGTLHPWTPTRFGAADWNHPNYSEAALLGHWVPLIWDPDNPPAWNPAQPHHRMVFGDVSTGGDLTPPVDGGGRMIFGGAGAVTWYTLSFTLKEGSQGLPGSAMQLPPQDPTGAVYTYVAAGGNRIHPDLVDTVSVEYTASQLGAVQPDGSIRSVSALDWGMGTISVTGSAAPSTFQPNRNFLYFSIDRSWVVANSPAEMTVELPTGGTDRVLVNSTTIFVMEWDGAAWSLPMVAMTTEQLLGTTPVEAHVDALSVDAGADPLDIRRVVFSLTADSIIEGTEPPDQILITQTAVPSTGIVGVTATTFHTSSGEMVSTKVGLDIAVSGGVTIGPDEVDGLCGRDPNELQNYDTWVGTPSQVAKAGAFQNLGLSLGRTREPNGSGQMVDHLFCSAHGIEASGWDFVFVEFDFDNYVGLPQHAETAAFKPEFSLPPLEVPLGKTELEFLAPFKFQKNANLRARARLHGVRLFPFQVEQNIAQSWVSILGPL